MVENQENAIATQDLSAYPKVDENPKYKNKEAANLDSNLNQDLIKMVDYLKTNKDKADSPEYMKCLESVKQMADKGYAVAQVEYARFLLDAGELTDAAKYFDKAYQNKNIDENTAKHLGKLSPDLSNKKQEIEKSNKTDQQKDHAQEPFKERYRKHPDDYPLVQTLEKHADNNHQETDQLVAEQKEQMQQQEKTHSENSAIYQRLIQNQSR